MSTVDSMLIMCSAAIVKDLYFHYVLKNDETKLPPSTVKRMSLAVTGVVGVIVFIAALKPPSLLVWINLFAFGGLEAVFFCPTLFGLYWKRANSTGALLSMAGGAAAFIFFTVTKISIAGTSAIVPTLVISTALFLAGSRFGRAEPAEKLKAFEI